MLHAASDPAKVTWRRGAYLEPHTPERPWESKGLTPVGMKPQAGVAAVTLCQRGSASLPIVPPARGKPRSGYCRQIAGFLKKYLDAATGAAFEIVGDDTAPARGIVVGPCAHEGLEPFIERAGRLEPEHFFVSAFAGGVALIGRDIKGRQRGNYVEA
ncbi:hypothetical protein H8D79_00615, partial [PVC group bacterium]|nr:hypothetical protein [PVC group bacterium]